MPIGSGSGCGHHAATQGVQDLGSIHRQKWGTNPGTSQRVDTARF